jgi:RNA polymerase sigma-70 factor (ECF subfamily)
MGRQDEPTSQTSLILLQGIRDREPKQWDRFVRLYGPLLDEWCRRAKIGEHDSADIVQEVFRAVAEQVDDFHRDQPGDSFRGWLWGITRHKWQEHFRQLARRPVAIGGSTANINLHNVADDFPVLPDESQSADDMQRLYHRALELLRTDFEPRTWKAFWSVVVEGRPAADVADELGMHAGAVYNAKYKVLKRLRDEFAGLI